MKYHLEEIKLKKTLLILLVILLSGQLFAREGIPKPPNPARLVNDYTKTLTTSEVSTLERKLVNFDNKTSNQIVVLLVNSFNGYSKAEFADLVGEEWNVGRKMEENGIVIVVRPKTRSSKGEVHIAVSNGLGGIIPDAITKRIVEYEMIPYFKKNDYYSALYKGTDVLMGLAKKEFNSNDYLKKTKSGNTLIKILPFLLILFIYYIIMRSGSRSTVGGRRSGSGLWTAFFLGSMMGSGGRSSGSWSNFSGGSGGFGGGGFGGFGGGGGGFGGGGAGGSW